MFLLIETKPIQGLWSADCWLNLFAKSGMFLTDLEEQNRLTLGRLMISSYAALSAEAVQQKKFLFRLRPKFHLLHHLTIDIRASNLNCNVHATWIDEDAIKRWMRIKKLVHKRTATQNVIQRFALGIRANLDRGLALIASRGAVQWARKNGFRECWLFEVTPGLHRWGPIFHKLFNLSDAFGMATQALQW